MKTIFHSFFAEREAKHKGAGLIECKGLQRTSFESPGWHPLLSSPDSSFSVPQPLACIWTESQILDLVLPSLRHRRYLEMLMGHGNGLEAQLPGTINISNFQIRVGSSGICCRKGNGKIRSWSLFSKTGVPCVSRCPVPLAVDVAKWTHWNARPIPLVTCYSCVLFFACLLAPRPPSFWFSSRE